MRALTEAESERAAAVFQEHQAFVESVARQFSPSPMHVPDIVQSVGVKVCLNLQTFRQDAQITTWLYRITKNVAMDVWRRESSQIVKARVRISELAPQDAVVDLDEQVHTNQRIEALHRAVERMRPKQQEAIRRLLDVDSVLVSSKSTKRRAMRTLRTLLTDDKVGDDGGG